ncbi:MAG: glutamate formimidoyltransferase [Methanobacteriota archaeon]
MARLVECVPNFSAGRDAATVEALADAVRLVPGVRLLDVQKDADHNRCVLTFLGEPDAARRAAFAAAEVAIRRIDMTAHKGQHPRIGAVDVVPFVPVQGVSMPECVKLAESLGEDLARRFDLPVYLYGEAARTEERRNLANIRKGEYEGLRDAIGRDPARRPDFGPARMHPTAGATVVGARPPLIAFNVNLATRDLSVAQEIAKMVRASSGGFPAVKGKGIDLAERSCVQVSMNIEDYRTTSIHAVFDRIRRESEARGVQVLESEVVGLLPMEALLDVAGDRLRLAGFRKEQVLENRLIADERE